MDPSPPVVLGLDELPPKFPLSVLDSAWTPRPPPLPVDDVDVGLVVSDGEPRPIRPREVEPIAARPRPDGGAPPSLPADDGDGRDPGRELEPAPPCPPGTLCTGGAPKDMSASLPWISRSCPGRMVCLASMP